MGQYEVVAPCAYIVDNKATVHRKLGVIVELDDGLAAGLPGALRPIARPVEVVPVPDPPAADPEPPAESSDPKPRPKPRNRADGPGSDGQD